MTKTTLTVAEAARIMREATKDKSYQLLPLGQRPPPTCARSASG